MHNEKYYPGICGAIVILICFLVIEIIIFQVFYGSNIRFGNCDPRTSVITAISTGVFFTFYAAIARISVYGVFNPVGKIPEGILLRGVFPVMFTTISSWWWLGFVEGYLASLFPEDPESLQMLDELMRGGFFTFFALCIVAPLSEEMLFRGVILRGFLVHYSPFNAILASSLLFGAVHGNVYQAPGAFIFGCFLGWLYYLGRSLWLPIFVHALWNFMVYVDFLTDESLIQPNSNNESDYGILMASFFMTILGLFICYVVLRPRNEK